MPSATQQAPQPAPSSASWLPAAIAGAGLVLAGAAAAWYFLVHKPDADEDKQPEQAAEEKQDKPNLNWRGNLNAKGVLINENNEAVDLTLRVSGNEGKGKGIITEKNQNCEGDVTAIPQPENKVLFDVAELKCPNGNNYDPFTLVCERGKANCIGTSKNGETWNLDVKIEGDAQ